jgi:hypothetical protein
MERLIRHIPERVTSELQAARTKLVEVLSRMTNRQSRKIDTDDRSTCLVIKVPIKPVISTDEHGHQTVKLNLGSLEDGYQHHTFGQRLRGK